MNKALEIWREGRLVWDSFSMFPIKKM